MELTNPPAFPQHEWTVYNKPTDCEGMTLLDYFVAHAPAIPPAWWKPEMPPQPFYHPTLERFITDNEEKKWLMFYNDEAETWHENDKDSYREDDEVRVTIPDSFKEKIKQWYIDWKTKYEAVQAWEEKEKIERLVQWPYFYATQILLRRSQPIK